MTLSFIYPLSCPFPARIILVLYPVNTLHNHDRVGVVVVRVLGLWLTWGTLFLVRRWHKHCHAGQAAPWRARIQLCSRMKTVTRCGRYSQTLLSPTLTISRGRKEGSASGESVKSVQRGKRHYVLGPSVRICSKGEEPVYFRSFRKNLFKWGRASMFRFHTYIHENSFIPLLTTRQWRTVYNSCGTKCPPEIVKNINSYNLQVRVWMGLQQTSKGGNCPPLVPPSGRQCWSGSYQCLFFTFSVLYREVLLHYWQLPPMEIHPHNSYNRLIKYVCA